MRRWAWGLLLLGAVAACTRQAPTPVAADVAEAVVKPDLETWNVRFALSEGGRPRARFEAPYMARYVTEDSLYAVLESAPDSAEGFVTAHLYDAEGAPSATVTARRIVYYERERRFEARGAVRVETGERRLEGEHLVWYDDAREVRTRGFVRVTTPDEQIQGYDLVADENLENYRLARVTGQVTLREGTL